MPLGAIALPDGGRPAELPWKRQALLARLPDLARGVHAVAIRQIERSYFLAFKRVWSDGTCAVVLSPLELVERLVALIPPPRAN